VASRMGERLGVVDIIGEVKVLDLRGELGRVIRRVEVTDVADARTPVAEGLPHLLYGGPHRGNTANSGNDNTPSHGRIPFTGWSAQLHAARRRSACVPASCSLQ